MSSPPPLPSQGELAEAGREQLGALHRLGVVLAHFGAEKLDRDVGAAGILTNEVDTYTGSVGRSFATARVVPASYVQPSPPPPAAWVVLAVVGGALGLSAAAALLLLGGRNARQQ